MVLDMIGGAMAYAYQYNMGRFQFDAGQSQAGAFQTQNLRLAQWALFREDCRDLFGITTNNMSTYILVGTLLVGFIYNFAWNQVQNYPLNPGWLMIHYQNSMYSSILYGMLSVWLAMHGTISAHTAGVKVLTQAVRPPIPSAAEVQMAGFDLAKYESAGAGKMFRAPALLQSGGSEPASPMIPGSAIGGKGAAGSKRSFGGVEGRHLRADYEAHRAHKALHTNEMGGPGSSASVGNHILLFKQLQSTYVPFESYARVSLLAATHHMLMATAYFFVGFYMIGHETKSNGHRNLFSAWAAVIMMTALSTILFKLDLFVGGFALQTVKVGVSAAPMMGALAANLWVVYVKYLRRHDAHPSDSPPFPSALPQWCALLSGMLHCSFELLFAWQARPDPHKANLPMNFRSVQYVDVFGWWDDAYQPSEAQDYVDTAVTKSEGAAPMASARSLGHNPPASISENAIDSTEIQKAQKESRKLLRTIQKLKDDHVAVHMSDAEQSQLDEIQAALEEGVESLGIADGSTLTRSCSKGSTKSKGETAPLFLRCSHETELGQEMPFFVNCGTGEVHWDEGELQGKAIDLKSIKGAVVELQGRHESGSQQTPAQPATRTLAARQNLANKSTHPIESADMRRVRISTVELSEIDQRENAAYGAERFSSVEISNSMNEDAPVFAEMPRRYHRKPETLSASPTKTHQKHSSMPWRYFSQATSLVAILWIATSIWTYYYHDSYYDSLYLNTHIIPQTPATAPAPAPAPARTPAKEPGSLMQIIGEGLSMPKSRKLGSLPLATQLPVVWPHKFLRPSAVACNHKALVFGDRFSIHIAELVSTDAPLLVRELFVAEDLPSPWRALAVTDGSSGDSSCPGLLLLERSGRAVVEVPLCGEVVSAQATARRWPLGESLDVALHSIAPMDKKGASGLCGDSAPWALHAVTERGEVIAFCASGGKMQPRHVVLAAPTSANTDASPAAHEFLGLQVDENGMLWVLSQARDTLQSELNAYAVESGIHRATWQLPSGRSWANGLCHLSGERGFILASNLLSDLGAHPEVWWFVNATNNIEVQFNGSATGSFLPQS